MKDSNWTGCRDEALFPHSRTPSTGCFSTASDPHFSHATGHSPLIPPPRPSTLLRIIVSFPFFFTFSMLLCIVLSFSVRELNLKFLIYVLDRIRLLLQLLPLHNFLIFFFTSSTSNKCSIDNSTAASGNFVISMFFAYMFMNNYLRSFKYFIVILIYDDYYNISLVIFDLH